MGFDDRALDKSFGEKLRLSLGCLLGAVLVSGAALGVWAFTPSGCLPTKRLISAECAGFVHVSDLASASEFEAFFDLLWDQMGEQLGPWRGLKQRPRHRFSLSTPRWIQKQLFVKPLMRSALTLAFEPGVDDPLDLTGAVEYGGSSRLMRFYANRWAGGSDEIERRYLDIEGSTFVHLPSNTAFAFRQGTAVGASSTWHLREGLQRMEQPADETLWLVQTFNRREAEGWHLFGAARTHGLDQALRRIAWSFSIDPPVNRFSGVDQVEWGIRLAAEDRVDLLLAFTRPRAGRDELRKSVEEFLHARKFDEGSPLEWRSRISEEQGRIEIHVTVHNLRKELEAALRAGLSLRAQLDFS